MSNRYVYAVHIFKICLENIRNLKNNSNLTGNFLANNTDICPLIVQNVSLRLLVNFLKPAMAYLSIFIAATFTIPGIFGNLMSLILLNLKKTDELYDGIIHYYGLIFSSDLLVVLCSIPNIWTAHSINVLLNINLLNPAAVYLPVCKFLA